MHPIPRPEVLNPDRVRSDEREDMTLDQHRSRARQCSDALHETAAYAITLWDHLDAVRQYLYESLPSDPRRPGPEPRACAAPAGPDDERGWEQWIATFASVTSALAGPQGDSGFGLSEARREADVRRDAPNLRLLVDKPATRPLATQKNAEPLPPVEPAPTTVPPTAMRTVKSVALGVLSALAIRGVLAERRLRFR